MITAQNRYSHADYIVSVHVDKNFLPRKLRSAFEAHIEEIITDENNKIFLFTDLERICHKIVLSTNSSKAMKFIDALKFAKVCYDPIKKEFSSIYIPKWFLIKITKELIRIYDLFT